MRNRTHDSVIDLAVNNSSQFSRTDVFDHAVVKPRFEILPIDLGKVLKSRFLCFFNLENH